jgi:hypothetical protein
MTDDKIQELNEGHLVELTKQETLEHIIDVIRNSSSYEDYFWGLLRQQVQLVFTVRRKPRLQSKISHSLTLRYTICVTAPTGRHAAIQDIKNQPVDGAADV